MVGKLSLQAVHFPKTLLFLALAGGVCVSLGLLRYRTLHEEPTVLFAPTPSINYTSYFNATANGRWPSFHEVWSCDGCLQVMQTEGEARLMVSLMTPGKNVLEFGSGKSTAFLPLFGVNLHSVEHYRPWYDIVRNLLKNSPRGNTVQYAYVEPNHPEKMDRVWLEESQYAWYKDYIRAARRWTRKGKYFDVALVDGRARPQVAVEVLYLADPNKLSDFRMLLHDFYPLGEKGGERDHYLIVENFYDKMLEKESMTVWRPKAKAKRLVDEFTHWPPWWCGEGALPNGRCTALK